MIARRRIIPRDEVAPAMRHEPAIDPRNRCHHKIALDGTEYRCGRQHVDGVHDAFVQHHDGGSVRW